MSALLPESNIRFRGGLRLKGETCRIIGIDLGERRTGVSISDDLAIFAHPLCVIEGKSQKQLISDLLGIAERNGAKAFVVGIPRNMDGTVGEQGKKAIRFARKLQNRGGLPVTLVDERLTTVQAEREMISLGASRKRRRMSIDEVAAVLILENYLRQNR